MTTVDFFGLVSAVIIAKWALTGAYPWLRFGVEGVEFLWSREFPAALLAWQREKRKEVSLDSGA